MIPAEAERKFLGQIGVHACLAIPLFSKDAFYGFIGLACCRGPRLWLAEEVLVLQTAAEIMMRCIGNRHLAEELTATMKNLEKTVNDRTCALRESKKRLAAEIAAHKKTLSHLKGLKAELADKNQTLLELTTLLAGLLNQNKWGPGEAEAWVLLKLKELIHSGVTNSVDSGPRNARPKYS